MDPYTSAFRVIDYTNADGVWKVTCLALTPPPGYPSDITIDILETELPANINQTNLANLIKQRLGWKLNKTFAPLNTFMANGTTVTLP